MSRVSQGGTKKWCPTCQSVQVCAAVNPSTLVQGIDRRWYKTNYAGIQWMTRA